jgi:hypothetical protein
MPSSCASSITTSVLLGWPPSVVLALGQLRADLGHHLVGHHRPQHGDVGAVPGVLQRHEVALGRTEEAGDVEARGDAPACEPASAEPIMLPPAAAPAAGCAAVPASLGGIEGVHCAPRAAPRRRCRPWPGCTAPAPGVVGRRPPPGRRSRPAGGAGANALNMRHDHTPGQHAASRSAGCCRSRRPGRASGEPGQAQAGGEAAEHGAPGRFGAAAAGAGVPGRACRVGGLLRTGRAWWPAASPAAGHVARLAAEGLAAAHAARRRRATAPAPAPHARKKVPTSSWSSPQSPKKTLRRSALDSNMQGDDAPRHVVIVHMAETPSFMRVLSSSWPGCMRIDSAR